VRRILGKAPHQSIVVSRMDIMFATAVWPTFSEIESCTLMDKMRQTSTDILRRVVVSSERL